MCIFILLYLLAIQSAPLVVVSPDFEDGGYIPSRYTCDGDDVNPTLIINGIPEETRSMVLIVEDPDATITTFTQWLVWNIPPQDTIRENTIPGVQGMNTVGKNPYRGPCPVAGAQRYAFKFFAIDRLLNLEVNAKRNDVEKAMAGHILASGQLVGEYNRIIAEGD